jgi:hypothetical protein
MRFTRTAVLLAALAGPAAARAWETLELKGSGWVNAGDVFRFCVRPVPLRPLGDVELGTASKGRFSFRGQRPSLAQRNPMWSAADSISPQWRAPTW